MNLKETAHIFTTMQLAYPDTFQRMSEVSLREMIRLWASMLAEDPPELVRAAVENYIRTSTERFLPTIGQIKESVRRLRYPEQLSEGEAWARISKALRNGYYGAEEEFSKLPELLQRVVGSPAQLREWAHMDCQVVQTVVASNVQRSYRAAAARQAELDKMNPAVRERLRQLSAQAFKDVDGGVLSLSADCRALPGSVDA